MNEIYWQFSKDTPAFFRDSLLQFVARTYYLTRDNFDGSKSQAWLRLFLHAPCCVFAPSAGQTSFLTSASNGRPNAAAPRPPFGNSCFVNTGAAKSRLMSDE
jgi:hypothetical protein